MDAAKSIYKVTTEYLPLAERLGAFPTAAKWLYLIGNKIMAIYDTEFMLNKEHEDRKAWLEANGLDEPLGCMDPLDILIQLEVEVEIDVTITTKLKP